MKKLLTLTILFATIISFSQELTGKQLLEKAITFHDPNGNWETFKGELFVTMEIPNSSPRKSRIRINLPEQYFLVKAVKDTIVTEYAIHKGDCSMAINGNTNPSEILKKKHGLSCERANLYKNYYTYLYGLPMKLKDKGTIIDEKVERKTFKGKEYLVLKATYSKEVGKDTWYFYFNPETYAMEVYQFFKEAKNSGEYILLSGLETINGIKMPKNRAWYYNKDNGYLGTDILSTKK
ncbi:hypothetical protein FDT66_11155 [Polaribacter aestuariivivens]|uniref:Uncharacterized protein n=1 Tax=Polaribacter aestuariivivens TaxID=2304626 RepID=A0A5S3N355_9FLAO|nr:DUF6503 family protein [Polaribacter aestuariivivens]TMM29663.1 hypothetical protein FDT66_11155 [Polaribacter aestuariivivens]